MKNPIELRREAEAKNEAIKAIFAGADKDEGTTDEERATIKGLEEARDKLKAQAVRIEEDEASRAAADDATSIFNAPAGATRTDPDADPVATVSEPGWLKDPMFGFANTTEYFHAIIKAGQAPRGSKLRPQLVHLSVEGVKARQKLEQDAFDNGKTITATVGSDEQSRFADPYGGFLIPDSTIPGLKTTSAPGDPISPFLGTLPMTTSTVKINARVDKDHSTTVTGGIQVYRRAEADTVSPTRMETEQIVYSTTPLMGIAYATNELLRDSPISFAALLSQAFGDAFVDKKMRERLGGTGVGELLGFLNEPSLISISKETNQTAATFVYDNALKMLARLWVVAGSRPVWLMNRTMMPQLPKLNVDVGQGGSAVFMGGASDAHGPIPDRLLGHPIIYTEYCQALGTKGDVMLINGSEYLEANWQPMQGVSSTHVRFSNNETTFKFFEENDARSWWRTALTPVNGDTLSPFVTLNERA